MDDDQYIKAFEMKDKRILELSKELREANRDKSGRFSAGFGVGWLTVSIIFSITVAINQYFS